MTRACIGDVFRESQTKQISSISGTLIRPGLHCRTRYRSTTRHYYKWVFFFFFLNHEKSRFSQILNGYNIAASVRGYPLRYALRAINSLFMEFARGYLLRVVYKRTWSGKVVYHYFRAHTEYNKLTKSLILPHAQVSPKVWPLPTRLLRIHEIAIFPETLDRTGAYDEYGEEKAGGGGVSIKKNLPLNFRLNFSKVY